MRGQSRDHARYRAMVWLLDHLDQPFRVAEVATALGVPPRVVHQAMAILKSNDCEITILSKRQYLIRKG